MLCSNCGKKCSPTAAFCGGCGTKMGAEAPMPTTSIKPKAKKSYVLPLVGLGVFVSTLMVLAILFFNHFGASLAVSQAMGNLREEIEERLATTPFSAVHMLMDSLQDGTVRVNFELIENWWGHTDIYRMDVELITDASTGARRLNLNWYEHWQNYDFSAVLTPQYFAMQSDLVGRDYYGFRLDRFRSEVDSFAAIAEWSNDEVRLMSDLVDSANRWLNQEEALLQTEAYIDVLVRVMRENEESENRVDLRVGGETQQVRRVTYTLNDEAILYLLQTWLDIFENDDQMRILFDSIGILNNEGPHFHRHVVRDLRQDLRELERDMNRRDEIVLAFYIGDGNRLMRLVMNSRVAGETHNLVLDLGASATDTWTLSIEEESRSSTHFTALDWDIRTQGNRYIHNLDITERIEWDRSLDMTNRTDFIFVTSDWSPDSGYFTLSVREDDRHNEIDGNLRITDGNFVFRMDYEERGDGWHDRFTLRISTTDDNTVGDVDYINITEWNRSLINRIEDAFY